MKRSIPFMLILAIVLSACGGDAITETDAPATNTDVVQQEGAETSMTEPSIRVENGIQYYETEAYSVEVPENWDIDVSKRMNTELILFAPYDSTNSIFRENVNMVIDPVGDSLALDVYIERAKGILAENMPGFGNLRERKESDRTWLFYDGEQQTMILHFSQMMAQKDDYIYIMTFTSNASETRNEAIAQDIMRTFRLK